MTTFPSFPGWDGIHPAMAQFPVALLLVAPLMLVISLFARQAWRAWAGSALVLMVLGTAAAWFAVASGHAAGQLVDKVQGLERAIGQHEALGIATRNLFTLLTVVWALVMLVPIWRKKALAPALRIGIQVGFFACYIVATAVLANTAMRGGLLVHDYGVRAMLGALPREATSAVAVTAPAEGGPATAVPAVVGPAPKEVKAR